jgi:UDP:flavonoid glycosyltransferase YjiC (YdhE family)
VLPLCTAVISHAGAGTMLGALCFGLPQLCLPQSTDQPFNAAALLPTGAGLALAPEELTADAVASAVGDLMHAPAFREAAQRLRTEIERMPGAETVLEQLVDEKDG